ncbi:MAG: toprim domain-containing protein [Promethearchaeota archaeon]
MTQRRLLEERYEQGIELLLEISEDGVPIVVEGIKDVATLRHIGLSGPIITLVGQSIVALADKLADFDRLLILFDFDRQGKRLTKKLTEQLQGRGIIIMEDIRQTLQHAFSWHTRVIEGLKKDVPQ